MKKFIYLPLLLFCFKGLTQEGRSSVIGVVLERSSKQPIEFATVQLLNPKDSSVIITTVTDNKGKFAFEKTNFGKFILGCSFIGFEKVIMPISVNQLRENIGNVEIGPLTKNMDEVVVASRKSLINTSIDRKVYNVSQDIMAQSGSASEILRNIPSVEVDIDGAVSLRGSSSIMILINGRTSPLMGKTRAEVLQQLPANSIERIEVITNPSARYKPDGTSGIINIVMKKNTNNGWNGTVVSNAGSNDRYNGSLSLNYKPGKLNVFSRYSIRQDYRYRVNDIDREYLDSIGRTMSYYTEDAIMPANSISHILSGGAEYNLSEANSVGISGNYLNRKMIKNDIVQKVFFDKNHVKTSSFNRLRYDPEHELESDVTIFWQHNFAKEDRELRLEFNGSAQDEVEDNHYTDVHLNPVSYKAFDNTLIKQKDHQQQITLDYTDPLSEDSKLEIGYDGRFNQVDLNFYGEKFVSAQAKFVKDIIKSNQFKYNESIQAVYGTYQHSYGAFGYSAGVRAEQAFINGYLVTKDSTIDNSYFKLYPTIHLSWKIKKDELQLNYSKRVNRPEGDDLNPFPEYQDPFNLRAGNPKLLPEIIHSFEFGYKWKNDKYSFVPSIYYRYKEQGFTSITIPLNDSVLLSTRQNLSNDRSTGLEMIFSAKAGKFLTANLSSNIFYNQIDASALGFSKNRSIVSMSTNFNATAALSKTTMWQMSCNIRSSRLTAQGKTYGSFVMNSGIRQELFKKKLSVTFTASDILKTLNQKSEISSVYLKQVSVGKRDTRIIYLGISYRFGKTPKKTGEEKLQFDNTL